MVMPSSHGRWKGAKTTARLVHANWWERKKEHKECGHSSHRKYCTYQRHGSESILMRAKNHWHIKEACKRTSSSILCLEWLLEESTSLPKGRYNISIMSSTINSTNKGCATSTTLFSGCRTELRAPFTLTFPLYIWKYLRIRFVYSQ